MNESLDNDGTDDDDSPVDDDDEKATILKHFWKAMDGWKEKILTTYMKVNWIKEWNILLKNWKNYKN